MNYQSCDLCGKIKYSLIGPYPGFEGIDLVTCEGCGLMQAQPIPSEEFLNEYYSKEFGHDPDMGFDMTDSAEKGFRLRAILQNDFVEKLIRPEHRAGKKILDIGCHAASFLSLFKARGWEVTGVDPNPRSSYGQKWYGIKVINQLFKIGMFESESFDAILHSHVLEHVRNPKDYLSDYRRILKPGGWAFIEVPNESLEKVKKGDEVNPHLYFFTPDTLKAMAEAAGFEVVATRVLGVEPLRTNLLSLPGLEWLRVRSQARFNARGELNLWTMLPFFGRILKEDRYFKGYHPKGCMLRALLRKPAHAKPI